jgi:hypothetical protein
LPGEGYAALGKDEDAKSSLLFAAERSTGVEGAASWSALGAIARRRGDYSGSIGWYGLGFRV